MFTFNGHNLRETTEQDREHCERWIANDPDHCGKVKVDYFIAKEDGIEKFVVEDKFGEPVFYFRQMRALRVDIQFGPAVSKEDRERNREALQFGFEWLREQAKLSGFRQMIFESNAFQLVMFCEKRLGFVKSPKELVCGIAPPDKQ